MPYTYIINRHAGTPDKNKTKTFSVHNKMGFIIILYSSSSSKIAIVTVRAYNNLEQFAFLQIFDPNLLVLSSIHVILPHSFCSYVLLIHNNLYFPY